MGSSWVPAGFQLASDRRLLFWVPAGFQLVSDRRLLFWVPAGFQLVSDQNLLLRVPAGFEIILIGSSRVPAVVRSGTTILGSSWVPASVRPIIRPKIVTGFQLEWVPADLPRSSWHGEACEANEYQSSYVDISDGSVIKA